MKKERHIHLKNILVLFIYHINFSFNLLTYKFLEFSYGKNSNLLKNNSKENSNLIGDKYIFRSYKNQTQNQSSSQSKCQTKSPSNSQSQRNCLNKDFYNYIVKKEGI
jgi:hypothetical protein